MVIRKPVIRKNVNLVINKDNRIRSLLSELKHESSKIKSQEILIEKLIKRVKERYPYFYKILIAERDKYMARKLYRIMLENKNKIIVAIVGAGHVPGILSRIKGEIEIEALDELDYLPSPSRMGKIVPWLIPAIGA